MQILKKYIFAAFLLCLSLGCTEDQGSIVPLNTIEFQLLNFTNVSYKEATLFIGGKDFNGNFIATDSIKYEFIPSNLSPNGQYTFLDNCPINCGSQGFVDGYHYFFKEGKEFVDVPFSLENNRWNPDLSKILEISDNFNFVLKLSNGEEGEIFGFDIRQTIINNPIPVNSNVQIHLTPTGIEGRTLF